MRPSSDSTQPDPDQLSRSSEESFEKAHELLDELKVVEEHEATLLRGDASTNASDES
jgi:hypothetical protein